MKIIQAEVYTFDELSEKAKEKAIEELTTDDHAYQEFVYEDATELGKIIGIEIDTKTRQLPSGRTIETPQIYYTGFWSQGDGASFDGTYRYKKGAVNAIKQATGNSEKELIRIATALQEIQKPYFYQLRAKCKQDSNHYYHSKTMRVDIYHNENPDIDVTEAEKELTILLRDFADWIYDQLEKQYEYSISEESVRFMCEANDYVFNEYGELVNIHVLQPVQDSKPIGETA